MPVPVIASQQSDYVFNSCELTGVSYPDLIKNYLPLAGVHGARPVPGTAEPGYSALYRNICVGTLKKSLLPGQDTYHAMWTNAARHFATRPALAARPYDYKLGTSAPEYVSQTFAETDTQKTQMGSGILHVLQHSPFRIPGLEAHDKISTHYADYRSFSSTKTSFILTLWSSNRPEWVVTDLACGAYSISNTVLYDTLGPSASEYILELVQSPILVCSYAHVKSALAMKRQDPERLKSLITIVSMDPLSCMSDREGAQLVEEARRLNIELFDLDQILGVGALFPQPEAPPHPDTVYTISFTSGTTGAVPKGVVLTQENAASGITFIQCMAPYVENDVEMAFLPLAHIFERQAIAFNLCRGGMSGFPQTNGTPLTLLEDLRLLKPTHMANVPRVYTKLESAIKNAVASGLAIKKTLLTKAISDKLARFTEDGATGKHLVHDALFISKIRKQMGFDNMVYCITGLAPISPLTIRFMKAALNMGFSQGFGLTELFAGLCFSNPHEKELSSCGSPGVCSEVRVRELPEMGYTLDNESGPMGELEIRGAQIFKYYLKNEEETAKVLHDGWFSTGDVARIGRDTGRIYIVDRVKNFFKLAQGEYVTPEKIENTYLLANPILTQCFVHGELVHSHLVAVIGVDKERLVAFLKDECGARSLELALDKEILAEVNKRESRAKLLRHVNGNVTGLNGYEKIKNLYVEFEPLTLEREVITPTVKLRRPIAAKFFKVQLDEMYDETDLLSEAKL